MHYALCASLCAPTYIQEQEIPNGQEEPDAPMKEAVGEEPDAPMKEAVGEGAFSDLPPGNYSLQLPETQASLADDLFAFADDRQAILACAHARAGAQELAVTTASFKYGRARRLRMQDSRYRPLRHSKMSSSPPFREVWSLRLTKLQTKCCASTTSMMATLARPRPMYMSTRSVSRDSGYNCYLDPSANFCVLFPPLLLSLYAGFSRQCGHGG